MTTDVAERLNAALEGRYRIERELGEGGMATVYLADDLRHERKVALKVLKPELAAVVGADRFLAEIKTTANLQHPHILPLFDSGEADSFLFYVMPYVEGESLRERLDREHQLPVDEAVRIASDVAEALDHAHRQGVVHRDIKPGNILLRDGRPVIADFGIALAMRAAGGHARVTETGLSLGTPRYMSPEQATGDQHVGPATDTYSLGCVLHEMLVGEPPYTGSTPQAILGKIIAGEPESVTEQRRSVPANVDAAIAKALEKVPADRFGSADGFAKSLVEPSFRHGASPSGGDTGLVSPLWRWLALAASGAAVGLATLAALTGGGAPDAAPTHLPISLPAGVEPIFDFSPTLAISPDGRRIAFVGDSSGTRLYVKDLSAPGDAISIPGSEGALAPFFSHDGQSLAFSAGNELRTVSMRGGEPVKLADVTNEFRGGVWSPDGAWIYYVPGIAGAIWRIEAGGGDPEPVTAPRHYGEDNAHFWPAILPGGETLMYTSCCARTSIMLFDLATRQQTPLIEAAFFARYVPTGHLVFAQRGSLVGATFDLDTRELGPRVTILDDIVTGAVDMHAEYAISTSGSLAYLTGRSGFEMQLIQINRGGERQVLDREFRPYVLELSLSPGGDRISLGLSEGNKDLLIFDYDRLDLVPLSVGSTNDFWSRWSRDGTHITFSSPRAGVVDLWEIPADRSSPAELLYASEHPKWAASWSPGDTLLAFEEQHPETGLDIWLYSRGENDASPFLAGPVNEGGPSFSPDGRWIAYHSDELGRYEVWVEPFEGSGSTCKASTAGGSYPRWSGRGELFYLQGGNVFVVDATNLDPCRPDPRIAFEGVEPTLWDVSPGGDFVVTVETRATPRLRLIQNWFEELNRLVPVD